MPRDPELADIERVLAILTPMRPDVRKRAVGFILQRIAEVDPAPAPPPVVVFPSRGGTDDAA